MYSQGSFQQINDFSGEDRDPERLRHRCPLSQLKSSRAESACPAKLLLLNMSGEWLCRSRYSVHHGSVSSSLSQKRFASVCQDKPGYAAVTDNPQNFSGLRQKNIFFFDCSARPVTLAMSRFHVIVTLGPRLVEQLALGPSPPHGQPYTGS